MRWKRSACRRVRQGKEPGDQEGTVMATRAHDWVTLHEASEAAKVSATTIRDWYVRGVIESKSPPGGTRLVRLMQVQQHATGVRLNQPAGLRDRLAVSGLEESESPEAAERLAQAILDLQALARDRLDASGTKV
jgi:hypothetical protein